MDIKKLKMEDIKIKDFEVQDFIEVGRIASKIDKDMIFDKLGDFAEKEYNEFRMTFEIIYEIINSNYYKVFYKLILYFIETPELTIEDIAKMNPYLLKDILEEINREFNLKDFFTFVQKA